MAVIQDIGSGDIFIRHQYLYPQLYYSKNPSPVIPRLYSDAHPWKHDVDIGGEHDNYNKNKPGIERLR